MSIISNNNTTASQYKPSATQKDVSAGFIEAKVGGVLSYQSGQQEQGLSELLGGMKPSEILKNNGGRLRIGPDLSSLEKIGHQSYTPNSKESLGFHAVSATGFHHTHASEIQANSVLTIDGLQATADSFVKAGVIGKDAQGNYILPETQKKLMK